MFGTVSSPGIYDRLAKLVLWIVCKLAEMPRRCVIQHLDDVCSASPADSDRAQVFFNTYQQVCEVLGVELAPLDDPDKAFRPSVSAMTQMILFGS